MAKLETLIDAFTGASINTALWNSITGTATLDAVNDQVSLAMPTTSGAANNFGTSSTWDATGSALYAQVTPAPNGNGGATTALKVSKDANNHVQIRLAAGAFQAVVTTGAAPVVTALPAYDPHTYRWWRIAESGNQFIVAAGADGLTWTTLATLSYGWSATAVTMAFQAAATTTEVAGNAATIAHVNTRLGGQANPNWPTVEHGVGLFWGANAGAVPLDLYVDVSARTMGQTGTGRGRQYETDEVRSGDESTVLANADGVLDPASVASPLAGRMQPFQPYRIRAQWPPTPNLLTRGIASGGDSGGATLGAITASLALDLLSDTDTAGGSVVSSATAWMGSNVTQFAVPSGAAAGQRIAHCGQVAVIPGQPYTLRLRVRDVTASTSLQVEAHLGWVTAGSHAPSTYTYGTPATLSGAAAPGWTTVTVSGTAPANALGISVGVAVAATAAAACTVQTDGWQVEHGLIASPWAMPGVWHPMYGGFTEDWASQWDMGGTYGTVTPASADAFSLLSQLTLQDPLTMEIDSHGPRYLYALADPSAAMTAADSIGACPAVPIIAAKAGAGAVSFGNPITAASPSGVYTGAAGTVVTLANPTPGVSTAVAASFLSLGAAGILGPAGATFTRMIAFRYTGPTPTAQADIWAAVDTPRIPAILNQCRLFIDSSGHPGLLLASSATSAVTLSLSIPVADGNWHLAVFGEDNSTGRVFLDVDDVYTENITGAGSPYFPLKILTDSIGADVDSALGNTATWAFTGDVSYAAEFPSAFTSTDCTNLYTAWRAAAAGESTGTRYARILRYAGYTGTTSIQAGLTTSMGPAAIDGQDAVSALQAVVETENGEHFIARDGTPTFRSRGARYNATTPTVTFGERTDLGELPYEDVKTVFDSTHLGNKIEVTQPSSGQVFYARDAASIAAYFPRTMTRTVNASSALEVQDAANYLKARYKAPLTRVISLVLHPAANPAMWAACLSLELGARARVMRRPPNLPATQLEVFVENLAWSLDDQANAVLTLQCSPADTTLYGTFAAWHTTLTAGIASGVSSITVNASADTVNPLALQLARGQLLVLGQNTANQETVTVSAVGTTSPGWSTAAITIAVPTTKSHAAGDAVCEPLPIGVTDPTTYDAASRFDYVAFAY